MNSKQRLRARLVLYAIFAAAFVLVVSLYHVQIIEGSEYAKKANKQYEKPSVALFDRGSIFFTSKDGTKAAAATVKSGYLVYMNPTQLGEPQGVYEALSHYMDLEREEFMRKANLKADPYEELVSRIDEDTGIAIGELGIPGIGIVKQSWRSYPANELAAQTLGIIGETRERTIEGRYGLEMYYEKILARQGTGGKNAFASLFSDIRDTVFGSHGNRGEIVTTIEPTVQKFLEEVLLKANLQWKPEQIGGIIMDPSNGQIIAMAALPSFNPNNLSNVRDISVLSNPIVEHVYEMGSIVKPLTMAVGLDTESITPSSTYNDEGTMEIADKKISNYDGKARGVVSMQEVLSQSLNIGAATIALEVGKEDFVRYFKKMGLADKTGIDEPNEATGIFGNFEAGGEVEIATAAYGQGIAMSPIATARALSVLANGGYLVRPHIVREINYSDGTSQPVVPEKDGPVIEKRTADDVTKMLVKVVDTALLKGGIKIDRYSVAAKTGTAQVPEPGKGYYSDRYLHSFFGYFPAYDAKFMVFLYQKYPKNANYASETLVEPFSEISKFLIDYYDVPPDR